VMMIITIIIVFFALGTQFPRAEKLSKLCEKKIKLYGVLQCASVGVLGQIVRGRTNW
jgi:H+/gluconate symporter-like permease